MLITLIEFQIEPSPKLFEASASCTVQIHLDVVVIEACNF